MEAPSASATAEADLSAAARRLLRRPRPRYRGVLHRWAALLSIPLGLWMIVSSSSGIERGVVAVFWVAVFAMFAVSAVTHGRDWPATRVEALVRLDHTAIFVMIAASATPLSVLGVGGGRGALMASIGWVVAGLGIALEWTAWHPPRGLTNTIYIGFGLSFLVYLPWMVAAMSPLELGMLFAGGAVYIGGALIVGTQTLDLWPDTFGYHEVWHVMVIIGVAIHGYLVWVLA